MTSGSGTNQMLDQLRVIDRSGREGGSLHDRMIADVRQGLSGAEKELPPVYFYDRRGSELFEEITRLDEYYQTRTERSILERIAPDLAGPVDLVEFGSGNSEKTRVLLRAMAGEGGLQTYHPVDVSRRFLLDAASDVSDAFPDLDVVPVVGDFHDGLAQIDRNGPALILFLGGTIGNLSPDEAEAFLRQVAEGMGPEDRFVVGFDLVKDPARLHRAYNDARGVTAEFNRNVLVVLNRELGAAFDPSAFDHYAFYDPRLRQIEMHLVSRRDQEVTVEGADMVVSFLEGESIRTEISRKFSRRTVEDLLGRAGLALDTWSTDEADLFALAGAVLKDHGDRT